MSYRRGPSPGRAVRRSRFIFMFSMFAIIASLLTPVLTLTASDAAAQGVPPNCDPGFVISDDGTTCVEDPNAQLDQQETPTETPTEVSCPDGQIPDGQGGCMADPNQPPQTVDVGFNKYLCPPDAVDYQQDYGQLAGACNLPIQPPGYTMWHNGPDGQTPLNITSNYSQTGAPAGQHTFGEQIPPGTTVAVYCAVWDPATGGQPAGSYTPVDGGGQVSYDVLPGQALWCDWFNIPPGGTITIYKWQCVEDTEYGRELEYYQGGLADQETGPCEQEHLNIPIQLTDANGARPEPNVTQSNGTQFDNVVPDVNGSFQVAITEPDGFGDPMVFCGTLDQPTQQPVPATGGVINIAPGAPTFDYQCNWYNIPVQQNSITIYKWLCEPGTEYGQDQAYYQGENGDPGPCEQEHLNIPIHLIDGGPAAPEKDTTTQANGTQFDNVVLDPSGSFQIWVEEPPDFGDPMVFCATLDEDAQSPVTATDGRITITPAGQPFTYQCNWYNLPGGTTTTGVTGTIVIEKYWCPPVLNFVQTPTRADMMAACTEGGEGVAVFKLTGPSGNEQPWPDQTISSPDPGPQSVNWQNLPEGEYTILENGLGSGWTSTVYCHESSGEPNGAADEMLTGPSVTRTLQPGYTIDCAWFNQPAGDGNSFTLYKWQCEGGTEYGRELEYYQGGLPDQDTGPCETEHNGVPFTVTDGAGSWPKDTVHNTTWEDLVWPQQGAIQVQETIQPPYGEPMVWCWYNDGDPQPVTTTGGLLDFPAPPDEPWTFYCNWYNIPTGEYNYVDLYKYECFGSVPEGADQSWYQDPNNCTPVPDWNFNVGWEGGGSSQATGESGKASWTGVPAGGWNMSETVPDGYGEPVIWCHYVEWPDGSGETGGWTMYTPVDGYYESTFGEGNWHIECYWYNFPPEDYNWVDFYKYVCDLDVPADGDIDYYFEECAPYQGWKFDLTWDGGSGSGTTDAAGHTSWSGVPQGSWTGSESLGEGWGTPLVWCRYVEWPDESGYNNDWFPMQVGLNGVASIGGSFDYDGIRIECYWFNFAPEYHLELYKYTCDYTVDRTLGLPDLGTNPSCAPDEGVSFTASFGAAPGSAYYTDANGYLDWPGVAGGPWSLTEGHMPGYAPPKVYCGPPQSGETPEVTVTNLTVSGMLDQNTPHIICYWFNFEEPTENGRITVYKYQCPPGTTSTDFGVLSESCTTPHNGIGFNLSGPAANVSASTVAGTVDWTNLDQGNYTVTETTVLPGYEPPLVWCGIVMQDGAPIDPGSIEWMSQPVTDRAISLTLDNFPKRIVCYWYNIPSDYGEVTIYKWTCPEGYDLSAWGADPKVDCTQATDGVTFTLKPPAGPNLQSDTGDSIPGAVYFGGLDPGAYTVTETVPPNTDYVFVLDCTGTDIPKVHQYPLSWGNKLDINVAGGDSIVCHWYNVPLPEKGWVTVTKYMCSTKTYTDKVYCTIYEKGQSIELVQVTGAVSKGVGITNAGGTYTWKDLDPGAYTVKEQGMVPCKMTASSVDGKGNALVVAGKGTQVNVYNCTSTPGKVPPGKVPGKYPNTGVGPESADNFLPAMQADPTGTPSPEDEAASEAFYQVDCVSGSVEAGTPAPSTPASDATAPPIEAEPTEAPAGTTPAPPATPEVGEDECARGAVPVHLTVESVGIDADFEYKEIVDGLMEQPTGPEQVAWYKDTARLGETNNVVVAGHLNWWNVPEGVFYRLQDMQAGDRIEVTGDDGQVYIYEVQTVTQESNLEPPGVDVIGPADEPTLTLITCGGEWNADIAEYDERTVVRAVLVETQPAEAAASG